jgi:membrane associated rhomboid family serine protease
MYLEPLSLLLVLANLVVYYLEQQTGNALALTYGLWPIESGRFQPLQLVTYSFLHASGVHLAANAFAMFMFGGEVEHRIGRLRFFVYVLCCIVCAALLQLAVAIIMGNSDRPTIGASGAVFGLLLAYAMLFPRQKLMPVILPIPIPAWLFVALYGVLELALGMLETADGIAHFAHLGGMLGGWLLMRYWLDKLPPEDRRAGA